MQENEEQCFVCPSGGEKAMPGFYMPVNDSS